MDQNLPFTSSSGSMTSAGIACLYPLISQDNNLLSPVHPGKRTASLLGKLPMKGLTVFCMGNVLTGKQPSTRGATGAGSTAEPFAENEKHVEGRSSTRRALITEKKGKARFSFVPNSVTTGKKKKVQLIYHTRFQTVPFLLKLKNVLQY